MEEHAIALGLIGNASTCCAVARRELVAMLRPGVTPLELGEDFTLAGALLATAISIELQGSDGFTAGDFTLRPAADHARADRLRQTALSLLRGSLVDSAFAFLGVRS